MDKKDKRKCKGRRPIPNHLGKKDSKNLNLSGMKTSPGISKKILIPPPLLKKMNF